MTYTSEFNLKNLLQTIFHTKKAQLMIQTVPQPTEAYKK